MKEIKRQELRIKEGRKRERMRNKGKKKNVGRENEKGGKGGKRREKGKIGREAVKESECHQCHISTTIVARHDLIAFVSNVKQIRGSENDRYD